MGAGPQSRGEAGVQGRGGSSEPWPPNRVCHVPAGGRRGLRAGAGSEQGPAAERWVGPAPLGEGRDLLSGARPEFKNPVGKNRAGSAREGRGCSVGVGSAQSRGSKCRAGPRAGGRGAGSAGRWSLKPNPARTPLGERVGLNCREPG